MGSVTDRVSIYPQFCAGQWLEYKQKKVLGLFPANSVSIMASHYKPHSWIFPGKLLLPLVYFKEEVCPARGPVPWCYWTESTWGPNVLNAWGGVYFTYSAALWPKLAILSFSHCRSVWPSHGGQWLDQSACGQECNVQNTWKWLSLSSGASFRES